MDQEEQGQVEELLAQGSNALSLSPCDALLKVIELEKSICFDRFFIGELFDMWHQGYELLNPKPIFLSYVDPSICTYIKDEVWAKYRIYKSFGWNI